MAKLIEILYLLITKAQFNSESERDDALDSLRDLADELLGAGTSIVPPKPGPTNAPAPDPVDLEPPAPVAEPVPADEQPEPPTSPEVTAASPEETNAFASEP